MLNQPHTPIAQALPYGGGYLPLPVLPVQPRLCLPNSRSPIGGEADLINKALLAPTDTPALEELARGRRSAVILIHDSETLRLELGAPVLVAEGTHDGHAFCTNFAARLEALMRAHPENLSWDYSERRLFGIVK